MVQMLRGTRRVHSRRKSGKALKIMNEMRLVIIPAIDRNIRPVNERCAMNLSQHTLKSLHAAERLRREPHLVVKQFHKPAMAQTDPIQH